MTVLAMSQGALSRFDTLMRVERREFRIEDAATLRGLKRRQIFRLLRRLREDGAAGLMFRKRGRPGNRRHKDAFRDKVVARVRELYAHVGPTLAREYQAERSVFLISSNTTGLLRHPPKSSRRPFPQP